MSHVVPLIGDTTKGKGVNGNVFFLHSDIEQAGTLNPFSHIYMFDVGFPPKLHVSIAQKFNRSLYATHLISYKRPTYIIKTFGFEVVFMGQQLKTSMHGKCLYFVPSSN